MLLGVLYRHGLGVPQNHAEAKKWFVRAAAAGNAEAVRELNELSELEASGPWTDPSTKITWGRKISGAVSWEQAKAYCSGYGDAGGAGWHLPKISELQTLEAHGVGSASESAPIRIPEGVHVWSSEAGTAPATARIHLFGGKPAGMMNVRGAQNVRAICVSTQEK